MDSPLLPTLRGQPLDDSSDLLADFSMDADGDADDSFLPSSPSRSHPIPRPPPPAFARRAPAQADGDVEGIKPKPRFSLFAPPRPPSAGSEANEEGEAEEGDGDETLDADAHRRELEDGGEEDDQTIHARALPQQSAAERDERLRESLYELRTMNEVFEGFLGALESARGHNERLEIRVRQTKTLLDEYTALLGQTEHTQRLLANPHWTGASDDHAALEAEEAARLEAEQRRQAEAERAAEAARVAEAERAQRAAEAERARESAAAAGARGRGGRGGTRGLVRGARGSGIPTSSRIPAPPTLAPGRDGTGGVSRTAPTVSTAGGTRYGHVQSSGYGPPRK